MQININISDDLDSISISDLIIAEINLGMLCDKLTEYDYDMRWVREKKEQVHDELGKKMKAENRRKLQKLEARREALLPSDILLQNVDNEIASLKTKLNLG
jgi:hypothetical protein